MSSLGLSYKGRKIKNRFNNGIYMTSACAAHLSIGSNVCTVSFSMGFPDISAIGKKVLFGQTVHLSCSVFLVLWHLVKLLSDDGATDRDCWTDGGSNECAKRNQYPTAKALQKEAAIKVDKKRQFRAAFCRCSLRITTYGQLSVQKSVLVDRRVALGDPG